MIELLEWPVLLGLACLFHGMFWGLLCLFSY